MTARVDHDVDAILAVGVGGATLTVLHTPGRAPGAVCLHAADLGSVFTGDTLFQGDRVRRGAPTATPA